jgi:hypothetical protein
MILGITRNFGVIEILLLCFVLLSCTKQIERGPVITTEARGVRLLWETSCEPLSREYSHGGLPYISPSGYIFTVKDSKLQCLDFKTGKLIWAKEVLVSPFLQVIEVDEKFIIYDSAQNGNLRFLDSRAGKIIWQTENVHPGGTIKVEMGRAYLYAQNFLYVYDLGNGKIAWKYDFPSTAGYKTTLTAFATSKRDIAISTYSTERGYEIVMSLDFLTGDQRWQKTGSLLTVQDGKVYIMKDQSGEVWIRSADTGEFLDVHLLENFTKDGIWIEEGDLIYTSKQRYIDPESTIIGKDGLKIKPAVAFVENEVIRVNHEKQTIIWHTRFKEDGFYELRKFPRTIVEVGATLKQREFIVIRLRGISIESGLTLWNLTIPYGVASLSATNRFIAVTTLNKKLYMYEISNR